MIAPLVRWLKKRRDRRLVVGQRRRPLARGDAREFTIKGPGEYDGFDATITFDDGSERDVSLTWLASHTELVTK